MKNTLFPWNFGILKFSIQMPSEQRPVHSQNQIDFPFKSIPILFPFTLQLIARNKMGRKLDKYTARKEKKRRNMEWMPRKAQNQREKRTHDHSMWFNKSCKEAKSLQIRKVNSSNFTIIKRNRNRTRYIRFLSGCECCCCCSCPLLAIWLDSTQFYSFLVSSRLHPLSALTWHTPKWKIYIETKLNISNAVLCMVLYVCVAGIIWMLRSPFQGDSHWVEFEWCSEQQRQQPV